MRKIYNVVLVITFLLHGCSNYDVYERGYKDGTSDILTMEAKSKTYDQSTHVGSAHPLPDDMGKLVKKYNIAIVVNESGRFSVSAAHVNGEELVAITRNKPNGNIGAVTGAVWYSSDERTFVIFNGADGLPEQIVAGDFVFIFSNYTDDSVDIAIISREKQIEVVKNVQLNADELFELKSLTSELSRSHPQHILVQFSTGINTQSLVKTLKWVSLAANIAGCGIAAVGLGSVTFGAAIAALAVPCGAAIVSGLRIAIEEDALGLGLSSTSVGLGAIGCADPNPVLATISCAALAIDISADVTDAATDTIYERSEAISQAEKRLVSSPPTNTAKPQPTRTPEPNYPTLYADQNYQCREGPGKTYKHVADIYAGTSYRIIGLSSNGWYKIAIDFSNTSHKDCWIGGGDAKGDLTTVEYYEAPTLPAPVSNFSSVTVNKRKITIYLMDAKDVDGDRVRLSVNGTTILSNYTLTGSYYAVEVSLNSGANTIVITALNTGSSGPNTVQISISNVAQGQSVQVSDDLETGQSVSLNITAP